MKRRWKRGLLYAFALAAAGLAGVAASWTVLSRQLDNNAYDFFFRVYTPPAWKTEAAILAIDEASLSAYGGVRGVRRALADGLELIRAAHPKAVAVDVILADETDDAVDDRALESALRETPNLVLSSDLLADAKSWDDPLPRFRRYAAAVGHVHADLDKFDGVSRELGLERATDRDRRWALALEAYRVAHHAVIVETPYTLEVGGISIPAAYASGRDLRIRYLAPGMPPLPRISVKQLHDHPKLAEIFRQRVVFAGETAQTAVRDRWMTPYSNGLLMPGVEIHANAYETIARQLWLTDARWANVLLWCALLVALAGLDFAFMRGGWANLGAALILITAHLLPYLLFRRGVVFPFVPGVATAWLAIVTAAAWRHWVTRRGLLLAESERARYQGALQFVTHEMRTPLTAIQGSSEMMGRYALPEEKRKQMAGMIHAESKRLARMIETFLNVERLSAGQMELKKERFDAGELMAQCVERVRPLAERKQIAIETEALPDETVTGDRELIEYAFYNLLTNAVKYSPGGTTVHVGGSAAREGVRMTVRDEGIGMDRKEVRRVFEKFYRTARAESSGEMGTGIGLSIVEQILTRHGGSVEVESEPGKGSTFTLVLPGRTA